MMLIVKLILAHCIGDFLLQPDHWVEDKKANKWKSIKLYKHVLLHLVITSLLVANLGYWLGILCIAVSHLVIDIWKLHYTAPSNARTLFFTDQVLHLLVLVAVAEYYTPFIMRVSEGYSMNSMFTLLLAILLVTNVSSHIIRILISKWEPENEDSNDDSLSNAGSYIGMLERVFVFGFMIAGQMQAIGFLLAAKSVFRFGDLKESKDRKLTEYILIGTLLSFGLAILISILFIQLKDMQ